MADHCAIGTIVKLDRNYFYLKVDQYVYTSLEYDTLKIRRFEDWSCGMRKFPYAVGQRELVFFQKSNYVLDEYDFIGYGGGDEFELLVDGDSVHYQRRYNLTETYPLSALLVVLCDALDYRLKRETLTSVKRQALLTVTKSKSYLHRLLISDEDYSGDDRPDLREGTFYFSLDMQVLYRNTPNRIYVNSDGLVYLASDSAEIEEKEGYFIVTPKGNQMYEQLRVYRSGLAQIGASDYHKTFVVLDLPDPVLRFDYTYGDSILYYPPSHAEAVHVFWESLEWGAYKYEVLGYSISVNSLGSIYTRQQFTPWFTPEVAERMQHLYNGDRIELSNVKVLYPDGTVHLLKGRSFMYCPEQEDN